MSIPDEPASVLDAPAAKAPAPASTTARSAPQAPQALSREAAGLQRLQQTAASRGGVCLSTCYVGVTARYVFRCAEGHEWETQGAVVRAGMWCPACARIEARRRNLLVANSELLQKAAQARGGECLSAPSSYTKLRTKYTFRCAEGHVWQTRGECIMRGLWCTPCANAASGPKMRLKDGLQRLQAAAASRGGVCLSETYLRASDSFRFRCANAHEWETPGGAVLAGRWCRRCHADSIRLTIGHAQALARARGGECVSTVYVGANDPLNWSCDRGHIWHASYQTIRAGHWCPECARINRITNRNSKARLRYGNSHLHNGEPD